MTDDTIMHYVHQERARCRALVAGLRKDHDFLIYCIDNAISMDEAEQHRKRFNEFPTDLEDLLS